MNIKTEASCLLRMSSCLLIEHADPLVLEDYDYGIWYMDALEHPHKYEGRTVTFAAKVYPINENRTHAYVAGREAHGLLQRRHSFDRHVGIYR